MRFCFRTLALALLTTLVIAGHPQWSFAASPEEFQKTIEAKARELAEVRSKREAVQRSLDELAESRQTLSRDLQMIDGNVSSLTYAIRENELALDRLSFEIAELEEAIVGHRAQIIRRREAIGELVRSMDEAEQDQPLSAFLRHGTLSEGMSRAVQSSVLTSQLVATIAGLRSAEASLEEKVEERERRQGSTARERQALTSRKAIVAEQRDEKQRLVLETKNREQAYTLQLDELERIQDKIEEEVNRIEAELRKTINPDLLPTAEDKFLAYPVDRPRITQGYGATKYAQRAYRSRWHNGIDFGGPLGTEILAAADGVVINVANQDAYRGCRGVAYGRFIVVKHGNGLATLYAHLSRTVVSAGERVSRGQVIGYMGRTGRATGVHLHFVVFASQTLKPARSGYPEGTEPSSRCGPMPVGGDLNPKDYLLPQGSSDSS